MGKDIVRKINKAVSYLKEGKIKELSDFLLVFPEVLTSASGDLSLLHEACYHSKSACKIIVTNGADINITDTLGSTVLNIYASQGDFEMVSFLLKHGAVVDMPETLGETALSWSIMGGHIKVAQLLLNHGANIFHELSNKNKFRIIDLASQSSNEIVRRWVSSLNL